MVSINQAVAFNDKDKFIILRAGENLVINCRDETSFFGKFLFYLVYF